jgi:hypothetical protein
MVSMSATSVLPAVRGLIALLASLTIVPLTDGYFGATTATATATAAATAAAAPAWGEGCWLQATCRG